eukprot:c25947_g1_i3 orf=248-1564(+)
MEQDAAAKIGSKRTHDRAGGGKVWYRTQQVCTYWLEGRCNRNPCNFLHTVGDASTTGPSNVVANKRSSVAPDDTAGGGRRNVSARWGSPRGFKGGRSHSNGSRRIRDKPCSFFLRNSCTRGEHCNYLHAHSSTPDMSLISQLTGHEKAVRAITLPANTNLLYTGGQDKTVRIWDCATGECCNVVSMAGDVGCLLSESGWIFIGLPNEVKAWNFQTNGEQSLTGPKGQVHALAVYNDMLVAGTQDGSILVWKFNPIANIFEPAASLCGHSGAVVTLEVAGGRLYSGSMDKSIRVWDLSSGHCVQTLQGHTNVVMGLLSWEQFLLSCSLDGTVKVWGVAQSGAFELQYTHPENLSPDEVLDGALSLCGFMDPQGKAILLCSYNNNTVRLFELPSFVERGLLFSREEVRVLHVGPKGLVFSGDSNGEVKVWKWTAPVSIAE